MHVCECVLRCIENIENQKLICRYRFHAELSGTNNMYHETNETLTGIGNREIIEIETLV